MKAHQVYQFVIPVYALVWVFSRRLAALLIPRRQGNVFLVGESGAIVPLLTKVASAPWRPSHAGLGTLQIQSLPRP